MADKRRRINRNNSNQASDTLREAPPSIICSTATPPNDPTKPPIPITPSRLSMKRTYKVKSKSNNTTDPSSLLTSPAFNDRDVKLSASSPFVSPVTNKLRKIRNRPKYKAKRDLSFRSTTLDAQSSINVKLDDKHQRRQVVAKLSKSEGDESDSETESDHDVAEEDSSSSTSLHNSGNNENDHGKKVNDRAKREDTMCTIRIRMEVERDKARVMASRRPWYVYL